jgi:hypothetical protein
MPRMETWEIDFLNSTPRELRELFLRAKAVAQPYIDKMNADPLNVAALHAEVTEKLVAISWEFTLRQDASRGR